MKDIMESEKRTVRAMIGLYCKALHKEGVLCEECAELLAYAEVRLDKCPFKEDKPACLKCTIHCYNPDMRGRIAPIMKYSGPRMLISHPLLAVRHTIKASKSLKK